MEAVTIGLADAVGTLRQSHDQLALLIRGGSKTSLIQGNIMKTQENTEMAAPDTAVLEKEAEVRICERMNALASIAAQAKRLGIEIDSVEALKNGVSPEALREKVLKEAAERDAQDVQSFTAPQTEADQGQSLLKAVRQMHPRGGE
jgi:hypothetical protein